MAIRLDHVGYGVHDLDEAMAKFRRQTGLAAYHAGRNAAGLEFWMVPLGDTYFEFLGVADEAATKTAGNNTTERLEALGGEGFTGWFLQTDSLEELEQIAERLGMKATYHRGGKVSPDGGFTEMWLLPELLTKYPGFSFNFLYWPEYDRYPGREHPAPHDVQPTKGFSWIELSADAAHEQELREMLGPECANLDIRFVDGPPGIRALGITTEAGETEIRP